MVTIRNLPPHRQPGYGGTGRRQGRAGWSSGIPAIASDVLVSGVAADRQARDPFPRGINATLASLGALDLFPSGDAAPGITEVGDDL